MDEEGSHEHAKRRDDILNKSVKCWVSLNYEIVDFNQETKYQNILSESLLTLQKN
jgi:hypothetical protein